MGRGATWPSKPPHDAVDAFLTAMEEQVSNVVQPTTYLVHRYVYEVRIFVLHRRNDSPPRSCSLICWHSCLCLSTNHLASSPLPPVHFSASSALPRGLSLSLLLLSSGPTSAEGSRHYHVTGYRALYQPIRGLSSSACRHHMTGQLSLLACHASLAYGSNMSVASHQ